MNNFNIEHEIDIVIDKLAEQLKVRIKKLIERSEKIVLREYINEQKQKTLHSTTRKNPVSKRNTTEKNQPVKRNPVKRKNTKRNTVGKNETSTRKVKNQSMTGKRVQREKEYSPTSPTSPNGSSASSSSSGYTSSDYTD